MLTVWEPRVQPPARKDMLVYFENKRLSFSLLILSVGIFDTVTFQSQPHFLHKRLVPKSLGPLKNSSKRLGSTHANSSLCLILVLFFILILCQKMYYTNHCILISKSKTDFLNLGIPLLESASTDFVLLEVSSLFRIESQTLSAQLNRKVIPA